MKTLSKASAERSIQKENDTLIEMNIRLRKLYGDITKKLNTVRENYDPQKLKVLDEFEKFCKDIMGKRTKLLEELSAIETLIKEKKEVFYSLVEKQDKLTEQEYTIGEQLKKLKLRETFVMDLEHKWREKNLTE